MSILASIARRLDGWVNTSAGLGDPSFDKAAAWQFIARGRLSDEVLASAYAEDDVVAAVASRAPDEELGRGYEITDTTTGKRLHKLEEAFESLGYPTTRRVFRSARIWEELFGGGAILIGAQDGRRADEPLDRRAVRRVEFLLSLDTRECRPEYSSVSYIARPSHYWVSVGGYTRRVHASRLVVFPGLPLPRRELQANRGWGASRVRLAWEAIQDFHSSWAGTRHLLVDGSQPVWKISGLSSIIASGAQETLRSRVALAEQTRSIARAVIVDKDEEEFERRDSSLQGLAPVLEQSFLRLSQAVKIPVEVLLGRAPAGLNSSGSFPLQLWYGRLESERELSLRPPMERVIDLVARSWEGPYGGAPPADWTLVLNPLGQLTDREDAEVDEIRVRTLAEAKERLGVDPAAATAKASEYLGVG